MDFYNFFIKNFPHSLYRTNFYTCFFSDEASLQNGLSSSYLDAFLNGPLQVALNLGNLLLKQLEAHFRD